MLSSKAVKHWVSLQSKGLSRLFSNTTVQKHQFFGAQLSLPAACSFPGENARSWEALGEARPGQSSLSAGALR